MELHFTFEGSRGEIAILESVCQCERVLSCVRVLPVCPGFVHVFGFCQYVRVLFVCPGSVCLSGFVSTSGFCLCVQFCPCVRVLSVCPGFVRTISSEQLRLL